MNICVHVSILQRSVWGEPHPYHLSHVHRSPHPLHLQHAHRGLHRPGQVRAVIIKRLPNIITVHLCIIICFLFFVHLSRLVLEFDLLVYAFGQFPLVVVTWMGMFLSVLVVPFVLLSGWASVYATSNHGTVWTVLAGSLLLLYQGLCLGFLPTYVVLKNSLPPASCFILILEQVWGHHGNGCCYFALFVLLMQILMQSVFSMKFQFLCTLLLMNVVLKCKFYLNCSA